MRNKNVKDILRATNVFIPMLWYLKRWINPMLTYNQWGFEYKVRDNGQDLNACAGVGWGLMDGDVIQPKTMHLESHVSFWGNGWQEVNVNDRWQVFDWPSFYRNSEYCYPGDHCIGNSVVSAYVVTWNEIICCPACRTSLIATRFWVVVICPIIKCLTVLEFSFILFDLCSFITIFNFILNYVPIVTFWIFTYHQNLNFVNYLLFYMKLLNYFFFNMFGSVLECCELTGVSLLWPWLIKWK